jgi:hypothetical protein
VTASPRGSSAWRTTSYAPALIRAGAYEVGPVPHGGVECGEEARFVVGHARDPGLDPDLGERRPQCDAVRVVDGGTGVSSSV